MKSSVPAYNGSVGHILFGFEGRCNRRDYWIKYFLPLCVIVIFIIYLIANEPEPEVPTSETTVAMIVQIVVGVLYNWIFIAVGKKRCQDMDRSPWFLIFTLLPVFNIWIFCVLAFKGGTPGPNKYGLSYEKTLAE